MCGLVAATAATACPLYSTLPEARELEAISRMLTRVSPISASLSTVSTRSSAVATARTPSTCSAREVSMLRMRAWAWGERSILPWSTSAGRTSAPYTARPVTLSSPS